MTTVEEDDISLLQIRWSRLMGLMEVKFGKLPNLDAIIFLIGVRELGVGPEDFTKEQKVDLMHIAICRLMEPQGYYKLSHLDQDGWPHWEQIKEVPFIDIFSQEIFLKSLIVDYFATIYDI